MIVAKRLLKVLDNRVVMTTAVFSYFQPPQLAPVLSFFVIVQEHGVSIGGSLLTIACNLDHQQKCWDKLQAVNQAVVTKYIKVDPISIL